MKILIVKFRTNDLDPSYGKQVEFSSKNIQEFFEFDKTEEYITFVYNDYNFKPSLDKKSIKGYLKLSPVRGDYKVYQNFDGSLFIKDFFIHELGLSLAANKDDFFILAKNSSKEYFLSYIPNSSDLGKFISKNNLSGKVVDVQREELDKSVDKGLDAKAQLSNLTLQRIVFGAPGTGKSHKLNDEALIFENQTRVILEKTMDENVIKDEVDKAIVAPKGRKLTSLNAIGFKYADFWKERTHLSKQEIRSFCKYQKISEIYLGAAAKFILDVDALKMTEEELSDITYIKALLHDDKKRGENDKLKWANAIGYKMGESDDYANLSLKDIEIELDLKGAQMWWLYRGIQAARLKEDEESISEEPFVERVTFHPNYSYAQFVGTYKPVQDDEDEKQIKYEYVPGPFMRVYRNAKKNPNNNFLLIIEEINRANVAAVFGDVFQLLDRKNGISEYPVAASEDIQKYLAKYGINERKLSIPSNMYIWATMNSADQGVFPMDTAFKRRWEFEYIGIDENEDGIKDYDIPLQKKEDDSHEWVKWNDLRHSINDKLTAMKINEDKLLGPYFISEEKLKLVEGKNEENANEFVKSFKSKVLMYLFEDAVKIRPGDLFDENAIGRLRFSDICKKFDEIGQGIFNF